MSIESELIQIRTETNTLRQLEHLLLSDEFRQTFHSASPASQQLPLFYIQRRDADALKEWIRIQKVGELESYSVRNLRIMAKDIKVRDYHLLTKVELIREIKQCRMNLTGPQSSENAFPYMS